MAITNAPPKPACPWCGSERYVSILHGYVELHFIQDVDGFWFEDPSNEAFALGWNGNDSYHQCNSCFYQCHFGNKGCPVEDCNNHEEEGDAT